MRAGVYREFARGFGVRDYRFLFGRAGRRRPGCRPPRSSGGAIWETRRSGEASSAMPSTPAGGRRTDSVAWLRTELDDYWSRKEPLAVVVRHVAAVDIDHWREDAAVARLVAGAVENDHV